MARGARAFAYAVLTIAAFPALVLVSAVVGVYALAEVAYGVVWLVALFVAFALGMRSQ